MGHRDRRPGSGSARRSVVGAVGVEAEAVVVAEVEAEGAEVEAEVAEAEVAEVAEVAVVEAEVAAEAAHRRP